MTDIIAILQLGVFYAYTYYIYKRFGVLTSISASTYSLKGNNRWLFLGFLWIIAILNLFQEMGVYGFLTAGGLIFTGITVDHESSAAHTDKVHVVGTVGAILATYLGLFVLHGFWIPSVILLGCAIALRKHKNFIWYIEIIAMTVGIGSYLLR